MISPENKGLLNKAIADKNLNKFIADGSFTDEEWKTIFEELFSMRDKEDVKAEIQALNADNLLMTVDYVDFTVEDYRTFFLGGFLDAKSVGEIEQLTANIIACKQSDESLYTQTSEKAGSVSLSIEKEVLNTQQKVSRLESEILNLLMKQLGGLLNQINFVKQVVATMNYDIAERKLNILKQSLESKKLKSKLMNLEIMESFTSIAKVQKEKANKLIASNNSLQFCKNKLTEKEQEATRIASQLLQKSSPPLRERSTKIQSEILSLQEAIIKHEGDINSINKEYEQKLLTMLNEFQSLINQPKILLDVNLSKEEQDFQEAKQILQEANEDAYGIEHSMDSRILEHLKSAVNRIENEVESSTLPAEVTEVTEVTKVTEVTEVNNPESQFSSSTATISSFTPGFDNTKITGSFPVVTELETAAMSHSQEVPKDAESHTTEELVTIESDLQEESLGVAKGVVSVQRPSFTL